VLDMTQFLPTDKPEGVVDTRIQYQQCLKDSIPWS